MNLPVLVKDKKGQKLLSLMREGTKEVDALDVVNENLEFVLRSFIMFSLLGSIALGFFVGGTVNLLLGILSSAALIASSLFIVVKADEKISYSRTKLLASLTTEEHPQVLKLIEDNDKKSSLLTQYHADPEIFIYKHLGGCSYDLALKIKMEMQKEGCADYLLEITNVDSPKHKELRDSIIRVGSKV